jgi:poly-gamma-glutamate synthesis protein (capsule biosynthesis protein)
MKNSGISLVTLANNHIFDAGESGFNDTLKILKSTGIKYCGGGKNLNEARKGCQVVIKDLKIGIISYTQWCIHRFASIAEDYPGILPLDQKLIEEDIQVLRANNDFVFVSLHWGYEDQPYVHPKQQEIAHALIDEGANAIIGHHPHVPHAIEIYKNCPILYSLGNLVFKQADTNWIFDNFLAEMIIENKRLAGIKIHPISGIKTDVSQPKILVGKRAYKMLCDLQIKSFVYGTKIGIMGDKGYIKLD